jgi:hypothetical protein
LTLPTGLFLIAAVTDDVRMVQLALALKSAGGR